MNFAEIVRSYWSQSGLPALTETVNWRVYLVKPSALFCHHSLLLQSDESEYAFTIELRVVKEDAGGQNVVPFSSLFGPSKNLQRDYDCLGRVTTTAKDLFGKALECLERFGDYHYISHNCQDYCKVFLTMTKEQNSLSLVTYTIHNKTQKSIIKIYLLKCIL